MIMTATRRLVIFLLTAITVFFPVVGRTDYSPQSALIPMPESVVAVSSSDPLDFSRGVRVVSHLPAGSDEEKTLMEIIGNRFGKMEAAASPLTTAMLAVDSSLPAEGYRLRAGDGVLDITGGSPAGVFYGLMTLDQLLLGDVPTTASGRMAAVEINDAPRYPRRALMLDPARHFLPVDDVKRYIDRMARYKYNVLQLHLTDDEGWRIEIKSHPELTDLGNRKSDSGYYSADDIRSIVDYAAGRHIEIVPELDIPGHTVAFLSAHPELGCTPADTVDKKVGDTHGLMLCASSPEVYRIYDDIIGEVAEMFPSEYIHLGGDESVIEKNWGHCRRDSVLMAEKGYDSPAQLMNVFFGEILKSVRKSGKKAILWCELDNIYPPANDYLFDYPDDVTLVTWRYGLTPKCIELTRVHGNNLIMAPGEYAYLDYPQLKGDLPEWNNWGMPVTTLQRSYEFDPGYGLAADEQAHITGVMATLWGEAIADINRATYMTYPRGLAIAEAAWSQPERRSWDSFKERLWPNLYDMMRSGVSVRVPFEIVDLQ